MVSIRLDWRFFKATISRDMPPDYQGCIRENILKTYIADSRHNIAGQK